MFTGWSNKMHHRECGGGRLGPEAGQAGEHVAGEAEQVEDDLDRAVRGEQPLAEDVQNYAEEESEGKRNQNLRDETELM